MNPISILLLAFAALVATMTTLAAEPTHLKLYAVDGRYADVSEDVALAIEGRGYVIERPLHIGEMLARTGKDLGTTREIFRDATALQFCPATVSRRMMEADPSNIVFCPYTIVIYTLPAESNKVYVGYRRPAIVGSAASQAALREVEATLDSIVREALDLK